MGFSDPKSYWTKVTGQKLLGKSYWARLGKNGNSARLGTGQDWKTGKDWTLGKTGNWARLGRLGKTGKDWTLGKTWQDWKLTTVKTERNLSWRLSEASVIFWPATRQTSREAEDTSREVTCNISSTGFFCVCKLLVYSR